MADQFFERPILNAPYAPPAQHWELDADGQPTGVLIGHRRPSNLITPVPRPKKRKQDVAQPELAFRAGDGISTEEQDYDPTPIINEIRIHVDAWRNLTNPDQWLVTCREAGLDMARLSAKDLVDAQPEAIASVGLALRSALRSLET